MSENSALIKILVTIFYSFLIGIYSVLVYIKFLKKINIDLEAIFIIEMSYIPIFILILMLVI